MLWEEFEKLAGYRVTYDTYHNVIEPMYMAIPEGISKADFVKMLDKKAFAIPEKKDYVRMMKKDAAALAEICGRYTDYETAIHLDNLARKMAKDVYGLDVNTDFSAYYYFIREYEFPGMRGCSYPREVVFGREGVGEYERIILVK